MDPYEKLVADVIAGMTADVDGVQLSDAACDAFGDDSYEVMSRLWALVDRAVVTVTFR